VSAADVTDGNSEEVARGDNEEEAAWLDLVGRFDAPASFPGAPPPWPERENLGGDRPAEGGPADAGPADAGPADAGPADGGPAQAGPGGGRPPAPGGLGPGSIVIWRSDSAGNGHGLTGGHETAGIPAGQGPPSSGQSPPGGQGAPGGQSPPGGRGAGVPNRPGSLSPSSSSALDDDDDEEHYVPPPPPPLPNLSPAAKGAWLGLIGGPVYLVVATLAGWSISGLWLFFAIGAFIAGFTVLILHLGDRDSGPDSDDEDGAVV
jgi:hypothetical protein